MGGQDVFQAIFYKLSLLDNFPGRFIERKESVLGFLKSRSSGPFLLSFCAALPVERSYLQPLSLHPVTNFIKSYSDFTQIRWDNIQYVAELKKLKKKFF